MWYSYFLDKRGKLSRFDFTCPCWISNQLYVWELSKYGLSSTVAGNQKKRDISIIAVIGCFISDGVNGSVKISLYLHLPSTVLLSLYLTETYSLLKAL